MSDLLELADRVLALKHQDRSLNCEIGDLLGDRFHYNFTGYVDAARRLLPDGFLWATGISFDVDTGLVTGWANVRNRDPYGDRRYIDISLQAAEPEIALVAAALQARAALSEAQAQSLSPAADDGGTLV